MQLPGIGVKRAGAVVRYRQRFGEINNSDKAFSRYEDLENVNGIGPKSARNISEMLKFE